MTPDAWYLNPDAGCRMQDMMQGARCRMQDASREMHMMHAAGCSLDLTWTHFISLEFTWAHKTNVPNTSDELRISLWILGFATTKRWWIRSLCVWCLLRDSSGMWHCLLYLLSPKEMRPCHIYIYTSNSVCIYIYTSVHIYIYMGVSILLSGSSWLLQITSETLWKYQNLCVLDLCAFDHVQK